jgi:hypothetical protein
VPELPGVWATGETLEACRRNLASALEDWILLSLAKGLTIPALGDVGLRQPRLVGPDDAAVAGFSARAGEQAAGVGF